jgi:hypothetical protein
MRRTEDSCMKSFYPESIKERNHLGVLDVSVKVVGGEWSASHPSRFTPGGSPPIPIGYKAGWAPELVWTTWRKFFILPGLNLQPVASRYTD